ncbi:hypothetical protein [Brevundimonas sp.]|uniref:hypothetical protein n=1 Tax=Brevundimonas sp. TaxID=1871086 RepID=UPI003569F95D
MTMFTARPGRARLYMQSPFTAELAPSLRVKQDRAYPASVYLALLLDLPDPDGYGAVVLDDDGYTRQAVALSPRSSSHLTIHRPVRFEIPGQPMVRGMALFNGQGELAAYGALRSAHAGYPAPSFIEFKSHQILVKRVDR